MVNELPIARPVLDEREQRAAAEVIASGWLAQGPRVVDFENEVAARVGAGHACAVSSGTAALELALRSVGVTAGDVVITVSHSFIATANAVRACGAEPVFVDIDIDTLNMAPAALATAIDQQFVRRDDAWWFGEIDRLARAPSPLSRISGPLGRLACILVAHQVGMPADLVAITSVAAKLNVPVVEDAACALGSTVQIDGEWTAIGKPHGSAACFSFHPRKIITTGEGGLLTCASAATARTARSLRQHGRDGELFLSAGFNFRMTDVQAAIGLVQLDKLNAIVAERRRLAAVYSRALSAIDGIRPPQEPAFARTNWQSYIPLLDDPSHQPRILETLARANIAAQPGIHCAHNQPPYRDLWNQDALPLSRAARDRGVSLPLFVGMSDGDVARVADKIDGALRG